MATGSDLLALHRYFIWANRCRIHFERACDAQHPQQALPVSLWFAAERSMFLSYWYAALYVVVEGWKELGCQDGEIDALLTSPNVVTSGGIGTMSAVFRNSISMTGFWS